MKFLYLAIDFCCILVPLILSFTKAFPFIKTWKSFIKANIIVGIFFIIWDIIFTQRGVWGFNPDYVCGIYFFNLPIEEVLFFFCIPFSCVFTFFVLNQWLTIDKNKSIGSLLGIITACICLFLIIKFNNRLYPFYTGLFLLIFMTFLLYQRVNLISYYLTYLLIFPFFIASNGLLTGSFLPKPVVWYNPEQIIGIRLWTIPIEDSLYGMLMLFMNFYFYNLFRGSKK